MLGPDTAVCPSQVLNARLAEKLNHVTDSSCFNIEGRCASLVVERTTDGGFHLTLLESLSIDSWKDAITKTFRLNADGSFNFGTSRKVGTVVNLTVEDWNNTRDIILGNNLDLADEDTDQKLIALHTLTSAWIVSETATNAPITVVPLQDKSQGIAGVVLSGNPSTVLGFVYAKRSSFFEVADLKVSFHPNPDDIISPLRFSVMGVNEKGDELDISHGGMAIPCGGL